MDILPTIRRTTPLIAGPLAAAISAGAIAPHPIHLQQPPAYVQECKDNACIHKTTHDTVIITNPNHGTGHNDHTQNGNHSGDGGHDPHIERDETVKIVTIKNTKTKPQPKPRGNTSLISLIKKILN
ncbi:MAG: hypothetical protein WC197_02215 [Candidatus Gastranaerophilaceae bacterium]|jgi:hypothetical protein